MSDSDLLAELRDVSICVTWDGSRIGYISEDLLKRTIAALTPGAAVVGCYTASESDHDRPPGSMR